MMQQINERAPKYVHCVIIHVFCRESTKNDLAFCYGLVDRGERPWLANNSPELRIVVKDADLADDWHDHFILKLWFEIEVGLLPKNHQFLVPGLLLVQFRENLSCIFSILQDRIDVEERVL